jgi:hypothetical protein
MYLYSWANGIEAESYAKYNREKMAAQRIRVKGGKNMMSEFHWHYSQSDCVRRIGYGFEQGQSIVFPFDL